MISGNTVIDTNPLTDYRCYHFFPLRDNLISGYIS